MALAAAYSPFAAAYFGALRCSCEFSRESEVETQSSVRGLIFSSTGQHHQYNCTSDLSLSSEQDGRGNYLQLISLYEILAARITLPHTVNTGHHIIVVDGVVVVVNMVKGKP